MSSGQNCCANPIWRWVVLTLSLDHFQNLNGTKFCTPKNKSFYLLSLHVQRKTTHSLLSGEHVKRKINIRPSPQPKSLVMASSAFSFTPTIVWLPTMEFNSKKVGSIKGIMQTTSCWQQALPREGMEWAVNAQRQEGSFGGGWKCPAPWLCWCLRGFYMDTIYRTYGVLQSSWLKKKKGNQDRDVLLPWDRSSYRSIEGDI